MAKQSKNRVKLIHKCLDELVAQLEKLVPTEEVNAYDRSTIAINTLYKQPKKKASQ